MRHSIKKALQSIAAAVVVSTTLSSVAHANLLTNGSFEADAQANHTWSIRNNLTGWTGGPNIELRNNVAGAAFDGVNYVELDTNRNSLMSQVVTTSGQFYDLTFAYSPRMNVGAASNGIEVIWNGMVVQTYTGNGSNTGNIWQTYSLKVLGTAPTSTLQFRAVGTSDSLGGSLDAVSLEVAAVPEPVSMALLGFGLAALGVSRRNKKA